MKQEDKDLLLKDLCARLPYGVKVHIKGEYRKSHKVEEIDVADNLIRYFENMHFYEERIDNCRLYLRPMSSMTEEEKKEYDKLFTIHSYEDTYCENWEWMDFMNSHHFDYRGLIEKGLAIEVTEENDPYK